MSWRDFWWLLAWASVLWYATLTVYVGIKGWTDIRAMLGRLSASASKGPKPLD